MGTNISITEIVACVRRLAHMVHRSSPFADRDDLVQEGFVGLLEAASRYDAARKASPLTYCGTRALGAMKDHVRNAARHASKTKSMIQQEDGAEEERFEPAEAERSAESREMLLRFTRFLRSAWKELPEPLSEIIRLRYVCGMPVREVAALKRMSPATIVRREHAGIAWLRQRFKDSAYGRLTPNE